MPSIKCKESENKTFLHDLTFFISLFFHSTRRAAEVKNIKKNGKHKVFVEGKNYAKKV